MIRDSASMSVMIETIGSRNLRWLQRKRDDFMSRDAASKHVLSAGRTHRISHAGNGSGNSSMPCIVRQNSRLQHAVSSLSSSSGSSTGNGSGAEEERRLAQRRKTVQGKSNNGEQGNLKSHHTDDTKQSSANGSGAKKVSSSSSSNDTSQQILHNPPSNDFHDYHAPSLEDPLPESGGSSPSSQDIESDNCVVGGKNMCTDSSSSEEDKATVPQSKRARKGDFRGLLNHNSHVASAAVARSAAASSLTQANVTKPSSLPPNIARTGGILHNVKVQPPMPAAAAAATSTSATTASLPNGHANLSRAPVTALPPFVGIGKRKHPPALSENGINNNPMAGMSSSTSKPLSIAVPNPPPPVANHGHGTDSSGSNNQKEEINNIDSSNSTSRGQGHVSNIITIDAETGTTSSQSSSQNHRGIQAHYHINEDDMILTDDVLMCPFIFRSQEAVWCGALAECVQPGMLRACFSSTNKLRNVEMIFDAMGFCQQLERASGNEGMAQIIPNSLEMALAPNLEEARVITLAKKPFQIVSVNEAWTAMTGYTQLDAEGKDLSILNGEHTEEGIPDMPTHDYENVASGVCAASTNVYYDINGKCFECCLE